MMSNAAQFTIPTSTINPKGEKNYAEKVLYRGRVDACAECGCDGAAATSTTGTTARHQNALEGRRCRARFHLAGHGRQDLQAE